jgi:hypothetical protein
VPPTSVAASVSASACNLATGHPPLFAPIVWPPPFNGFGDHIVARSACRGIAAVPQSLGIAARISQNWLVLLLTFGLSRIRMFHRRNIATFLGV